MNELELASCAMRAKYGDKQAFACLYSYYSRDLYRFAFYTLGHRQDAEDAVSEAVADAFSSIRKLREVSAFKGWIFAILAKKCRKKLAGYARDRRTLAEEPTIPPALSEDFDEDRINDALLLYRALSVLSSEERLILSLSIVNGYNSREIAQICGSNPGTVRSRLSRATAKLRAQLQS